MDKSKTKGRSRTARKGTVPVGEKLALSVAEVADTCGISPSLVRRLIADGVLPRVPHTDRVLIARSAVVRWIESEQVAS